MKGFELTVWRKQRSLTQAVLAEELGLATRTIVRYERGEEIPDHIERALDKIIAPVTEGSPLPRRALLATLDDLKTRVAALETRIERVEKR